MSEPEPVTYPAPAQDETEHTITLSITVPDFGRPGDRHDLKAAAAVLDAVKLSVDSRATGKVVLDSDRTTVVKIPTTAQIIGKDS